jgi:hypothetical protein
VRLYIAYMDWERPDAAARLLSRVVAIGFPELRRLRIPIAFKDLPEEECFACEYDGGLYSVSISRALRNAPRRVLEGGIAHELSHILHDSRLGPWQRDLAYERYRRSAAYRYRDERATEVRQIERGYGPQLVELLRYARRLGQRFTREDGLMPGEIVRRMRKRRDGAATAPWRPRL